MSASPSRDLIAELVTANHILSDQGVVDAFGHVSVRHDKRSDRFLLARNLAPGQVAADDIIEFGLDGEAAGEESRSVYLERFIHSEIYRARPDVMSVIHSHSPAIVPLTVAKGTVLRPIFHMAAFLGDGAPVFDIRDTAGPSTDLLITDARLGQALATHFGANEIVLMRGHGSTVIGSTIRQAVFRAVYADVNARFQITAASLGEVEYLTMGEARACKATVEAQVERPWNLWKQSISKQAGRQ